MNMDNSRFLAILNRALRESGVDPAVPASPTDPGAVAAWAGFLRACVAGGVSIADPRWRELEVRAKDGHHLLALSAKGRRAPDPVDPGDSHGDPGDKTDFTLGLSLLMSMLGPGSGRDDC